MLCCNWTWIKFCVGKPGIGNCKINLLLDMMGITVYRCQQIKENNCEQSTVLYVIAVQSLKPAALRDTLTASQWSGMCFFSGIFRCHFYGNAVWFLAGYRTPQYMESVKWKCQRSRISQSSANCLVWKSESLHREETCKYDATGSDNMCNCCICMVHFLV